MDKNSINSTFTRQIEGFFITNCHALSKEELYKEARKRYPVSVKHISAIYLRLLKRGQVAPPIPTWEPTNLSEQQVNKIIKQEGENLSVSVNVDFDVRTLEDLFHACEVDVAKWEVTSWQCKKWDLGIKNKDEKIETKQLFSVAAKFKPRKLDTDPALQKAVILKELFAEAPPLVYFNYREDCDEFDRNCEVPSPKPEFLLELALFDVHFGKMAHREECGEDYDLKIAAKRYVQAISDLLSRIDHNTIDRILLPIGNDMINIDNTQGTTTGGTPQDSDSRFYKIVRTVKNLLIEQISNLTLIAPVDVVVVAGNHDEQTSFLIGEMVEAYFHNTKRVTVYNTANPRKYYHYGNTSFMFTHGNKEKHANLGMIFAAENPKLWAATKQRYVQLGHYHSNKKINYLSNEEFQGFQIQIIPSLSGSDAWHTGKGFNSLKQAKGFLYHKEKGLVAEYTHTIL